MVAEIYLTQYPPGKLKLANIGAQTLCEEFDWRELVEPCLEII